MAHSEYVVPLPRPFRRHQQEVTHICKAKILCPLDTLIKIPVFVCQTYTTAWSTIFWFFGSKTHDSSTSAGVPPPHIFAIFGHEHFKQPDRSSN